MDDVCERVLMGMSKQSRPQCHAIVLDRQNILINKLLCVFSAGGGGFPEWFILCVRVFVTARFAAFGFPLFLWHV